MGCRRIPQSESIVFGCDLRRKAVIAANTHTQRVGSHLYLDYSAAQSAARLVCGAATPPHPPAFALPAFGCPRSILVCCRQKCGRHPSRSLFSTIRRQSPPGDPDYRRALYPVASELVDTSLWLGLPTVAVSLTAAVSASRLARLLRTEAKVSEPPAFADACRLARLGGRESHISGGPPDTNRHSHHYALRSIFLSTLLVLRNTKLKERGSKDGHRSCQRRHQTAGEQTRISSPFWGPHVFFGDPKENTSVVTVTLIVFRHFGPSHLMYQRCYA